MKRETKGQLSSRLQLVSVSSSSAAAAAPTTTRRGYKSRFLSFLASFSFSFVWQLDQARERAKASLSAAEPSRTAKPKNNALLVGLFSFDDDDT